MEVPQCPSWSCGACVKHMTRKRNNTKHTFKTHTSTAHFFAESVFHVDMDAESDQAHRIPFMSVSGEGSEPDVSSHGC